MPLYSPLEDFMERSVSTVEGLWSKLEYVASLRGEEGNYEHWGLARVFGKEPAGRAMEQAHRNLVLEVLHTPLDRLMGEAQTSARQQDVPLHAYMQQLQSRENELLPERLGGGSAKHFSSVLLALLFLAACPPKCTAATHQAS